MAPREPNAAHGGARSWIRSNVLGLVAIFIALSGSAVAAQVADDGRTTVSKAKKGPRGRPGPPGPQGVQGIQGLQGPAGGLSNVIVERTEVAVPISSGNGGYAVCPTGRTLVGGGAAFTGGGDLGGEDVIVSSGPTDSSTAFSTTLDGDVADRWYGQFVTTGAADTGYVFALCAL